MIFGPVAGRLASWPLSRVAMVTVLAILLAGCSVGGGSPDSAPDATPVPTLQPTPTPVAQLGAVTWTTALDDTGAPREDLEAIRRDAGAIYAVVPVDSVTAGETVTAQWSIDGVPIDALGSTVTIDEASESGWVSFALTWEGETLWPVGTLGIAISASSGATATGEVQIEST